jgi:hypothetical protein
MSNAPPVPKATETSSPPDRSRFTKHQPYSPLKRFLIRRPPLWREERETRDPNPSHRHTIEHTATSLGASRPSIRLTRTSSLSDSSPAGICRELPGTAFPPPAGAEGSTDGRSNCHFLGGSFHGGSGRGPRSIFTGWKDWMPMKWVTTPSSPWMGVMSSLFIRGVPEGGKRRG